MPAGHSIEPPPRPHQRPQPAIKPLLNLIAPSTPLTTTSPAKPAHHHKRPTTTMNLNPTTKALINTIQRQLKNPITGTAFYTNDSDLIADAVTAFHQQLKAKRLIK